MLAKQPPGRLKWRWEDSIEIDCKVRLGFANVDCVELTQVRVL